MVIDPLVTGTTNNVTKSTSLIQQIKKMLLFAAGTLWADCTCSLHRDNMALYQKYSSGQMVFCDKGHSLLGNLFAAVTLLKQSNRLKVS